MFYAYEPTFITVLRWEKESRREMFLREHTHYRICTYEEACAMNPLVSDDITVSAQILLDTYVYDAVGYYPVWSRVYSDSDKTPYITDVHKFIEYEKSRRGL